MYERKFVINSNFIVYFNKNIYFRNVTNYINYIKNIINVKSVELIRQNLYICF